MLKMFIAYSELLDLPFHTGQISYTYHGSLLICVKLLLCIHRVSVKLPSGFDQCVNYYERFACRNLHHLLYGPFAIFIVSWGKHALSRDAIYLFIFSRKVLKMGYCLKKESFFELQINENGARVSNYYRIKCKGITLLPNEY